MTIEIPTNLDLSLEVYSVYAFLKNNGDLIAAKLLEDIAEAGKLWILEDKLKEFKETYKALKFRFPDDKFSVFELKNFLEIYEQDLRNILEENSVVLN